MSDVGFAEAASSATRERACRRRRSVPASSSASSAFALAAWGQPMDQGRAAIGSSAPHVVRGPQSRRLLLQRRALRAVADQGEAYVGAALAGQRDGLYEHRLALARRHARDVENLYRVGADRTIAVSCEDLELDP